MTQGKLPVFLATLLLVSCISDPPTSGGEGVREDSTPQVEGAGTEVVQSSEPDVPLSRPGWTTSTLAIPTGDPQTSALVLEKSSPSEIGVGTPFEYEIVVRNRSPQAMRGLVVTDRMPDHFDLEGARPAPEAWNGGQARWTKDELGPGEEWRMQIRGRALQPGTLSHSARLEVDARVAVSTEVVSPALMLTKSAPAETIRADVLQVQYVVANSGTGTARDVRIVEKLPEGLTTLAGNSELVVNVGDVYAGERSEVIAKIRALRTGRFESGATAMAEGGLVADSNLTVTTVRQPALELTGTVEERIVIGRPMTFQWNLRNVGDGVSKDTIVEQIIPEGTRFLSASDGGELANGRLQWNVGTLHPDMATTLEAVLQPAQHGIFTSQAVAKGYCADPASASATCEAAGIPALALELTDLEDPIAVGNEQTYLVSIRNQGTAPATGIQIEVEFEENWQLLTADGPTMHQLEGRKVLFEPLESLAAKDSCTYRLIMRAESPGDTRFSLRLTSLQLTRPVLETESTLVYR